MRLLTRKIHRAFPELDTYDDDHCRRFIKSARSSFWVMLAHSAAIIAVTLPILALGLVGAVWLSDKWRIFDFAGSSDVLSLRLLAWLPAGGAMMAAGPIAGYIVRDVLLRRRLRYVLRTRGGCPGCGYSVIGLAVTERADGLSFVRCPECGVEVEVDPSLAELTLPEPDGVGGAGAAVGVVGVGGVGVGGATATGRVFVAGRKVDMAVFWNERRKKLAKRTVITLLVVVFGGTALTLGINEVLTRWTAAAARRDLAATRAKLRALAASMQAATFNAKPAASPQPTAWDHLMLAQGEMERLDRAEWRDAQSTADASWVYPEFAFLDRPELMLPDPNGQYTTNQTLEQNQASLALARRMIGVYRDKNVFRHVAGAAACPFLSVPDAEFDTDPRSFPGMARITAARQLIRVLRGRMAMAAEAGDQAEFIASIEGFLAISRACAAYPRGYEQLMAAAAEDACESGVRKWLIPPESRPAPDLAWLPDIAAALERGRPATQFASALDGDALWAESSVQMFFANPANFRWGRLSTPFRAQTVGQQGWASMARTLRETRLGTYRENLRELREFYAAFAPGVAGAGSSIQIPVAAMPPRDLGLLRGIAGAPYYVTTIDDMLAGRRGLDLWIALERCRLETGAYPASLGGLVPKFISAIPADPWTGAAPVYRTLTEGEDARGRRFLLYFVGRDLTDNGGTGGPTTPGWTPGAPRDFVVNDPTR